MDQEIKNEFDKLGLFLRQNMVTKEELDQKLEEKLERLPTKDDFSQLQGSVDGLAGRYKDHDDELKIVGERTTRMEQWIIGAAKKIGVSYKP